ncbi:MAG: HD domain-containing phosphohydrolase [Alphaproteobacteria bacterium]
MQTLLANKHAVALIDSTSHRGEVEKALTSFYEVASYSDGREALKKLAAQPPAIILVGEEVTPGSSLSFIRAARGERALSEIPVLYIIDKKNFGLIAEGKAAGTSDFITKPYRRSELIKAISRQLNASIEHEWEALPVLQRSALKGTADVFGNLADVLSTGETLPLNAVKDAVQPLVTAIENNDFKAILEGVRNHDDYTYAHSMRVATMLSLLGHAAGFKNDEQLMLASGGLLHDVGKMTIPHHILNKPGRLDAAEFEIMKSHVPETIKYLKAAGNMPNAIFIIAEQHHEKIDGTGYPNGLKGAELNELARMAAVVDVFSALTDRRVYKPPMESSKAIEIMKNEMTTHLDQNFVKMFSSILTDADILS